MSLKEIGYESELSKIQFSSLYSLARKMQETQNY